jgi:hypothetical protein
MGLVIYQIETLNRVLEYFLYLFVCDNYGLSDPEYLNSLLIFGNYEEIFFNVFGDWDGCSIDLCCGSRRCRST